MHRTLIIALAMLLLVPAAAQADLGAFADKVADKVESAATRAEEGLERAGSGVQSGASSMGDKMDSAFKPVRDKLARNEYRLSQDSKLHAGPDPRAKITAVFQAGTKAVVDDWSDDKLWGHVRIRHRGKVYEGWMAKDSLSKVD